MNVFDSSPSASASWVFVCRLFRIVALALCLLLPGPVFAATPLPAGSSFTAAFSPHGTSLAVVLSCIRAAKREILVAVFSFTSRPISAALLEAHKRGVAVRVVVDKRDDRGQYTAAVYLANRGVPVRTNGRYDLHHNKFLVVDGRHVQTGSFNYSRAAAEKNAENVLVLWDVPILADQYAAEWRRLWQEGEPLPARY